MMDPQTSTSSAPEPSHIQSPPVHRSFKPDLVTLILKESDQRLRQHYIEMLSLLLNNTEKRFSIAEESESWNSSAYIPYSFRVAAELRCLHRRLAWVLLSERSAALKIALVRCIHSLVSVTPYQRLRPGLISSLLPTLNKFLLQSDDKFTKTDNIRSAVLCIWGTLLQKSTTPFTEISAILLEPPTAHPNLGRKSVDGMVIGARTTDSHSQVRSTCWLVELCLLFINNATDYPTPAAIVAVNRDDTVHLNNNERSESPTNSLRIQAICLLARFVGSFYEYLQPSIADILKTIRLRLQSSFCGDRPLKSNIFRLCSSLLSHIIDEMFSRSKDVNDLSCNDTVSQETLLWWLETMRIIVDGLHTDAEESECWWSCHTLELFTELHFLTAGDNIQTEFLENAAEKLSRLCTIRRDGVQSKALHTLFRIALAGYSSFSTRLISYCIKLMVELWPSASPLMSFEIAYCIELATVHLLSMGSLYEVDCEYIEILKICIQLCSLQSTDSLTDAKSEYTAVSGVAEVYAEGCRNSDSRRCEHAIHGLVNLLELMAAEIIELAPTSLLIDAFEVLSKLLRASSFSGAEKVRWNAALSVSKILKRRCFVISVIYTDQKLVDANNNSKGFIVQPIVDALCGVLANDNYFKVRAHASLSLLLLFKNTLNSSLDESFLLLTDPMDLSNLLKPTVPLSSPILDSTLSLLCVTSEKSDISLSWNLKTSSVENQHNYLCIFVSILLLFHITLYSLLALRGTCPDLLPVARRNVEKISSVLAKVQSPAYTCLLKHLLNSFIYAKYSEETVLPFLPNTNSHFMPGDSLKKPTAYEKFKTYNAKTSSKSRYLGLEDFRFHNSSAALLKAAELLEVLLSLAYHDDLSPAILNISILPSLVLTSTDNELSVKKETVSHFRTIYD